jgi:hypothetical protein
VRVDSPETVAGGVFICDEPDDSKSGIERIEDCRVED